MTRLAAVLAAVATPAAAEVTISINPDNMHPHFATITLENEVRPPPSGSVMVLETPLGPVTVNHDETPNRGIIGGVPDTLEIIDQPSGTIAIPPGISVEENSVGHIKLFIWEGM